MFRAIIVSTTKKYWCEDACEVTSTSSAGGEAGGGGVAIASPATAASSVSKVARVVASTPSIVFSSETGSRST